MKKHYIKPLSTKDRANNALAVCVALKPAFNYLTNGGIECQCKHIAYAGNSFLEAIEAASRVESDIGEGSPVTSWFLDVMPDGRIVGVYGGKLHETASENAKGEIVEVHTFERPGCGSYVPEPYTMSRSSIINGLLHMITDHPCCTATLRLAIEALRENS